MSRPDPIEYAERLYAAIRGANFSPISFLAFGNAVKDGVSLRNIPRIAAEPFMRVVGEMLDLEEEVAEEDDDILDAESIEDDRPAEASQAIVVPAPASAPTPPVAAVAPPPVDHAPAAAATLAATDEPPAPGSAPSADGVNAATVHAAPGTEKRRNGRR